MHLRADGTARLLASFYRKSQYEDYGGREWMNLVLALGDLGPRIIDIMNDIIKGRTALASTQGRPRKVSHPRAEREPTERPGLHHTTSEAKSLREAAKLLDKRIRRQEDLWRTRPWQCMPWATWNRLLQERSDAWDHAERVSEASGQPYTDRAGQRRNDAPRDMVGLALRQYCNEVGLEYL